MHFQQYPSIERQDLTQSQLGSFKFTPVDHAPRDTQYEVNWPGLMHSELLSDQPVRAGRKTRQNQHSDCTRNSEHSLPTFFNNLDRQHHFLGPTINSYTTKKETANLRAGSVPRHNRSSEMNPSASAFVPSYPPPPPAETFRDLDDITISTQTMFRALSLEQQAHQATKTALEEAKSDLSVAKKENKRLRSEQRSLVKAVEMLGAIIKQNEPILKHLSVNAREITAENPQPAAEEVVVGPQPEPILYDVLSRRKGELEDPRTQEPAVDQNQIFDLDLLKSPTSADPEAAALSRKLGKPFLIVSEDVEENAVPAKSAKDDTILIQITPEKEREVQMDDHNHNLRLPASFLAKYQPKKNKMATGIGENITASSTDNDNYLSRQSSLGTPSKPIKTINPLDDHVSNFTMPNSFHHQAIKAFPTQFIRPDETMVTGGAPLKLNIKWKVTAENPIFDDEDDKMASLGLARLSHNQESHFYKHPVRYIEYAEKNLFRTVMIDYIPLGSSYHDVLSNIYGGAVEKIELFGPIGNSASTKYMTARIVFHYELAASKTASYARDHQMKVNEKNVRVWQVITQTYPKNRQLERDVFENMYTRLLLVNLKTASITDEAKDQLRKSLPGKLEWLKSSIIEFTKTIDGFDLIEFTGVRQATLAMEQLRTDVEFGGIEMDFEDDPCAEPYP